MRPEELVRFDVAVDETDLAVFAERDLTRETEAAVRLLRRELETYAAAHDGFVSALRPLEAAARAPEIVRRMSEAAASWDVGPMAAVAGAVADMTGEALLDYSSEVIVENGGDVFISSRRERKIAIFAGEESPFGSELALVVRPQSRIRGVCTSSGTLGHSLSLGMADAVVVLAGSASFADAAATAVANRVAGPEDVEKIVEQERRRGALAGLVIIAGDRLGAFGAVEFA
jgi:ApbE superfamily uncharacterized protein (UPF0280 family)